MKTSKILVAFLCTLFVAFTSCKSEEQKLDEKTFDAIAFTCENYLATADDVKTKLTAEGFVYASSIEEGDIEIYTKNFAGDPLFFQSETPEPLAGITDLSTILMVAYNKEGLFNYIEAMYILPTVDFVKTYSKLSQKSYTYSSNRFPYTWNTTTSKFDGYAQWQAYINEEKNLYSNDIDMINKVLEVGGINQEGYNTMVESLQQNGVKDRTQFDTDLTTSTPTAILEALYGVEKDGIKMQYIYQYASETNKELFAEGENATIIISMCEVAGKKITKLPAKKPSIAESFLMK
ncbi:MAG: hypothetical protein J6J29_03540 [Paludibacteraceae bacterium]|nr:hypothetical protein [Paludibacteraceae bacterium]